MSAAESLAIAQVTPYPLEADHPVTAHVLRLADELSALGHRVVVLTASRDHARVAETRRRLKSEAALLLPEAGADPVVLTVGEALPAIPGVDRAPALAVDAARTVDDALSQIPFDLVHVHEPFGPSVCSAALRHSRALNVGTFHLPAERFIAGMGAGASGSGGGSDLLRKRSGRLLGRLDDRLATSAATAALVARSFPIGRGYAPRVPPPPYAGLAADEVPDGVALPGTSAPDDAEGHDPADRDAPGAPGTDAPAAAPSTALAARRPVHIVLPLDEERAARRTAMRALRRLGTDLDWRATVVVADDDVVPVGAGNLGAGVRDRVAFVPSPVLPADADVVVLASSGTRPAPHVLVEALQNGTVPVASRIDVHDELTDGGVRGPLFEPGDVDVLVQQLERLIERPEALARFRDAAREDPLTEPDWDAYTAWVVDRYDALLARRHDRGRFDPAVVARLRERPLIDVDLHMHTDHSGDCATPVEVLLDAARKQGLGAIAVTDHNEVSGAHEAALKAAEYGVKIIIGEEVKTADQGEVIGLFIDEKIPKGVTLQEAIADIRRQGGLVYVPHPFDRMHSVPDYEHMLDIVHEIDAVEVFNPRVAIASFNEEAARFAAKYRMVAGAGSDSHVAQGLGSVRLRMRDFDGPEEFLASLADAEIRTKSGTLVYVQALKFLETVATPAPARRLVRERRVRRATRG
ncbi:PHP domain-containing protein [Patulibacter sp.]|uniref:PHP domain-containing protein n=1 Tax=Patulibacter sp. TaxID=1912859 RepID=UPI0027197745|nr:PHP domain-containing protein [Patulibacter sp.]MDO9407579.1 glycosyltransferase [Patulibacter sp.]